MSHRKVLLFANTSWYLYNFRLSLARRLQELGWEVVLVAPNGEYAGRLAGLGFRFIPFDFQTRGTNPLRELTVLGRLIRLYRQERPTIVHHFTIKCVLYGSLAARLAGRIPAVNAVTGLGWIFTNDSLPTRTSRPIVKALYRLVLRLVPCRVVFQNTEDRDLFLQEGLVPANRTDVIRGSGVDGTRFRPTRKDEGMQSANGTTRVLFASRLLRDKGVFELLEAARVIRQRGLQADFLFAGDTYPDNPSSLTERDLDWLGRQEFVRYLGHVEQMPELLRRCDIVVLPSYREGTPRVLIEAAASGKPIVATDIAGCRGVVRHGVNGLLVPVGDVDALVDALTTLILRPDLRLAFGREGRSIVLSEFENSVVLRRTIAVYEDLLAAGGQGSRAVAELPELRRV